MTGPTGAVRVTVATESVDFRQGAEGLAALVQEMIRDVPFTGIVYVFRAKRAHRINLASGTGPAWYRLRSDWRAARADSHSPKYGRVIRPARRSRQDPARRRYTSSRGRNGRRAVSIREAGSRECVPRSRRSGDLARSRSFQPQPLSTASTCDAKASFSSTRSISSQPSPVRANSTMLTINSVKKASQLD